MSVKSEKKHVEKYLAEHDLEKVINEVLNVCLRERPQDPFALVGKLLRERSSAGKGISSVIGRLVWDGDGKQVQEVEVRTDNGVFRGQVGCAKVKSDFVRVEGEAFLDAFANFILKGLTGKNPVDLEQVDQTLLALDLSENKCEIGANSIYAASIAVARAGAATKNMSLYRHLGAIGGRKEFALPVPWVTAVTLEREELGLVPIGFETLSDAVTGVNQVLDVINTKGNWKEKSVQEAFDELVRVIKELELFDKVKLSISIRESYIEQEQVQEQSVTIEETIAETKEAENSKNAKKGQGVKGKGAKEKTAAIEIPPASDTKDNLDRTLVRDFVQELLTDEEKRSVVAIVENLFQPNQWKAMEHFVEEYGDHVVLFNQYDRDSSTEEDDQDGEQQQEKDEENQGEESAEKKKAEGGKADASRPASAQSASSGESDDQGLPPCNGDIVFAGTPFHSICTVSDLIGHVELKQNQGQAIALTWEEANTCSDTFAADFSVAMSTGLVKVGNLRNPANVLRINELLRLEQELSTTAFYAASRFRSPF